jgi:hypothetical protein
MAKITREKFIEHYTVIYTKELLERLPVEANTTNMLLCAGRIINDVNTHVISGMHKAMEDKK